MVRKIVDVSVSLRLDTVAASGLRFAAPLRNSGIWGRLSWCRGKARMRSSGSCYTIHTLCGANMNCVKGYTDTPLPHEGNFKFHEN